jgi:hypothetical protein
MDGYWIGLSTKYSSRETVSLINDLHHLLKPPMGKVHPGTEKSTFKGNPRNHKYF